MIGVDSSFWLKLILLIAIVFILMFAFNTIMRKWLKVEEYKWFSANYVNEKHKKIDGAIRITAFFFILLAFFMTSSKRELTNSNWFLQPGVIVFVFIIASEILRAVMERKYAKNSNAYKITISQIVFAIILVVTLLKTGFWGLI